MREAKGVADQSPRLTLWAVYIRPVACGTALIVMLGALERGLTAQCPDGSPPPCGRTTARVLAPNSVAVLYLDNLSSDTANAFLADALTEEIIIRLGQVQRLQVKSRFEVQRLRGRPVPDPQVLGRSLNAAYLVTGSVQRSGERVRLHIALVRSATRAQVWGDVIDRSSNDILTIESDIAKEVVIGVTGQLLPEERTRLTRPLTNDPVAYLEYLRGMHDLRDSYEDAALVSGIAHLERAIGRDSGFAAAYAGLANAWAGLADGYVSSREGYGRAREAARHALALDSTQSLAYVMLAEATRAIDLDAGASMRLTRAALALDPRNSAAYTEQSEMLLSAGEFDQSIAAARRGWELDSLEAFQTAWYFGTLLAGHHLDSAAALLPRFRASLPSTLVDALEGRLAFARGDIPTAERLLRWRSYGGIDAGRVVRILVARGDTATARATIDSMLAMRSATYFNAMALARAYSAIGDIDNGITWLQRAFDDRTVWVWWTPVDDELAPLRKDSRYASIVEQLRF